MCGEDCTDDQDEEAGPPTDSSESGGGELGPSDVFELLADDRDRFVLYLLADRGGTIAIDELARMTAAWEYGKKPDEVSRETKRRVARRLHHVCLPRLADHGVVTRIDDPDAVTLSADGESLEPYLDFAMDQERRDVDCYLEAAG